MIDARYSESNASSYIVMVLYKGLVRCPKSRRQHRNRARTSWIQRRMNKENECVKPNRLCCTLLLNSNLSPQRDLLCVISAVWNHWLFSNDGKSIFENDQGKACTLNCSKNLDFILHK